MAENLIAASLSQFIEIGDPAAASAWTTIVDTSDITAPQVLERIYAICHDEAKALPALVP